MAAANTAFVIHDYEPKVEPGRYDEQVRALAEENIKRAADGRKPAAIDIQVPTKDVAKHKRYFQVSAKNFRSEQAPAGYTGRADATQENGDETIITFILIDRIERKPKDEDEDTSAESEDSKAA